MESVTVREVRLNFSRVLNRHAPVLVTRTGKLVAAVVPLHSDSEVEDFILANSPRIGRMLRAAERDLAQGRTVSLEAYLARHRRR